MGHPARIPASDGRSIGRASPIFLGPRTLCEHGAPGEVSLVLQGSLRSKLAAANRLLLDMTWQRGVKTSFTRILLVDDEGNLRMIITGMLEQSDGSSGW
jgi:hypothetical protein